MHPKVYIETSVISFYFEKRKEPEMVARRNWTVDWWKNEADCFTCLTSTAVINELQRGSHPNKEECLNLIKELALLPVEKEIFDIAKVYIKHKLMPDDLTGDALHLSLASFYRCDYLLTWNCRHLANLNKITHIRTINMLLDLYTPIMATPLQLLGGDK
jgi:predicted nucleic acid-binding protein